MAAPQRKYQERPYARPEEKRTSQRSAGHGPRRKRANASHRRFLVLVVVPMLLMLGSIYLHTVAANLGTEAEQLKGRISQAGDDKQRLDLQVAQLSSPGRVIGIAQKKLGMRAPNGKNLQIYSNHGEDAKRNGGEQAKENRKSPP